MGMNSLNSSSRELRYVLLVVRWPVGGIRTFLKYVITFYPSDRYRFLVVGTSTEGMRALQEDIGDLVEDWTLVPVDGRELRNFLKSVWQLNRDHRIDLVHAHGFTSTISCLISGLFNNTPVLCTSHDVLQEKQFVGAKGYFRKLVLKFALARCRLIHSVSLDAENNLLSVFPSLKKKSVAFPNGVNTAQFKDAPPDNLKQKLGIQLSTTLIGFFGRFMGQKGFRFLVEAIGILAQDESIGNFHVVCFGSGAFIREEQDDIKKRGLESYFSFVGFTPDVSGAMKGCDLIAMPSLWEACPLQPMEAMCAGVPFVGSDCIGLREVLKGTPAIQVKAGDAGSLAEGIVKCMKTGRKPFEAYAPIAVERFDVRKTANEIHALYERAIE